MKRIVIVDDETHVIRVLRLALENQGYEVIPATNGEKALEYIKEAPPDVLITDIAMPRMDGKKLCQIIRSSYPGQNILILVMTSHTERDEREWVKNMSNIVLLEKPLSLMQLVTRLKEHFENGVENAGNIP